jgi:copper/silver efflux system protein
VIARWIDLCARNRFLVFTGTLLLVLAGIWAERRMPLDALPDISDVQVIIHTAWNEPPNVIEDQVTYPIVTALLAAPSVKAVRAQTMFGDSYVFVVFEDDTDLYWARSRVLEYLQQIAGRLPAGVHPVIGPDATAAGWVYEYLIVDHNHRNSLADLRSLQDWFLRYQIETVPGVAEVASIGGFVRQYQVRVDPDKLLAFNIPLSTVIDKVRDSTNEVGGRLLEFRGAEYMVRGRASEAASRRRSREGFRETASAKARGVEDGATPEAHRSSEVRGDQSPRSWRGNACRDWPLLQRVRLDDFETLTTMPLEDLG